MERLLPHDTVYNARYFEFVDREAMASAPGIVRHLVEQFAPSSVMDVGCGTGAVLAELRSAGVSTHMGLEYAEAALEYCRSRGLTVRKFDLEATDEPALPASLDLVISLEVAEHLPARVAGRFVALLTRAGAPVVLTAAPPGQGGTDHVNEQPRAYWVALFRAHGFDFDVETTAALSAGWKAAGATWWYHQNVMVFRPVRPTAT
jgi:SAM-dependent methyltransferase